MNSFEIFMVLLWWVFKPSFKGIRKEALLEIISLWKASGRQFGLFGHINQLPKRVGEVVTNRKQRRAMKDKYPKLSDCSNGSPYAKGKIFGVESFDIVSGGCYDLTEEEQFERNEEFFTETVTTRKTIQLVNGDHKEHIDVLELVIQLCENQDIRQLVYNNSWGVHMQNPVKSAFPENVVIGELHSLIKEALKFESLKDRAKILLFLDAAPKGSIAYKVWAKFETLKLRPVTYKCEVSEVSHEQPNILLSENVEELDKRRAYIDSKKKQWASFTGNSWEKQIEKAMKDNEDMPIEIPTEDRDFWREKYGPMFSFELDATVNLFQKWNGYKMVKLDSNDKRAQMTKTIKQTWFSINEKAVNNEFKLV